MVFLIGWFIQDHRIGEPWAAFSPTKRSRMLQRSGICTKMSINVYNGSPQWVDLASFWIATNSSFLAFVGS
jgi:hypothetical protein